MRILALGGLLASIAAPLHAQVSGRTMQVLAPTVLGQTAAFGMTHPSAAAGNPYAFLWCMPPFAGTQSLTVPGFAVLGLLRVAPATSVSSYSGVLGAGGSVAHSLVIPSHPSFLGVSWDLQSVDLAVGTATVALADNDLELAIVDRPPPHLDMVPIAPGSFLMGSPVAPLGAHPYFNQAEAQPVHAVTIGRPFWIGRHEVTQGQYQAVVGTNPSFFQGVAQPNSAQCPVEQVTWHDAVAYCAALTTMEQAAGRLPAGYVYRLPTEAEWEYCCRAGTTTEFHYGASLACGQANFGYSYHSSSVCPSPGNVRTTTVGTYSPNPWGLHDTHGNVWEWCLDSWDGSTSYPAGPVTDPYVAIGTGRVLRGGGWYDYSGACRSAFRNWSAPVTSGAYGGFRVVCAPVLP